MAWTIALLTVPVLYVLTFPPLVILMQNLHNMPDRWFEIYAAPISWMHRNTPASKPMEDYAKWWADMLGYKGPI
jgi:hypothetical protein